MRVPVAPTQAPLCVLLCAPLPTGRAVLQAALLAPTLTPNPPARPGGAGALASPSLGGGTGADIVRTKYTPLDDDSDSSDSDMEAMLMHKYGIRGM
jgi:hypothetical protein